MTDKKMIFVIPAKENVPVRKPEGGFLSADGEELIRSSYWLRRIKDGDVTKLSEEKAKEILDARKKAKAKLIEEQKKAVEQQRKAELAKEKAKSQSETKGE
ncbi:TPA: DUF2635 domain-containing protein [Vibrio parahaemolyticus]|uniref:DUF2635 domain-containing protein n=1 Tax=Vibrio parahaemolyticus TaxID=670 RepID=UPI001302D4DD|nr:DUF2635 domain-containing protein [Vibrio parahaemolyticus]